MSSQIEQELTAEIQQWEQEFQQECWKMYVDQKSTTVVVTKEFLSLVAKYFQGGEHLKFVEDHFHMSYGRHGHDKLLKFRHKVKKKKYLCIPSPDGGPENIVTVPRDTDREDSPRLPIVPVEDFFKTLYNLHISADHAMSSIITRMVRQQYKGIPRSAIELFLRGTICCNKFKPVVKSELLPNRMLITTSNTFVQLKIINMTKKPSSGYNYICQLQDCVTKFRSMLPLRTKSDSEVNNAVRQLVGFQGPPQTLHVVEETDFPEVHDIFKDWPDCPDVEIVRGWPSFLKYQGIVKMDERSENLVDGFIAKAENKWKRQGIRTAYPWSTYLPILQYEINRSYNKDICMTPYEMVFGVKDMLRRASANMLDLAKDADTPQDIEGDAGEISEDEMAAKSVSISPSDIVSTEASASTSATSEVLATSVTSVEDLASQIITEIPISSCEVHVPSTSGEVQVPASSKAVSGSGGNVKFLLKPATPSNRANFKPVSKSPPTKIVKVSTPTKRSGSISSMEEGSQPLRKVLRRSDYAAGDYSASPNRKTLTLVTPQTAATRMVAVPTQSRKDLRAPKTAKTPMKREVVEQFVEDSELDPEPFESEISHEAGDFEVGDFVSLALPKEYCRNVKRRLPGIVVQKVGSRRPSYVIRSAYGVLETTVKGQWLQPYPDNLELSLADWEEAPIVSMKTAAEHLCVFLGNSYGSGYCGCSSFCRTNSCPCRQARVKCVTSCHEKQKKTICKNGFEVTQVEDTGINEPVARQHEDAATDDEVVEETEEVFEVHLPDGMAEDDASRLLEQSYFEDGVLYLPGEMADRVVVQQ